MEVRKATRPGAILDRSRPYHSIKEEKERRIKKYQKMLEEGKRLFEDEESP